MKEVLRIDVMLDGVEKVQGAGGEVTVICFHGTFSCDLGSGTILPGGVDTQIQRKGEDKLLSARYILEGKDAQGSPFRIFVENNGICKEGEPLLTHPVIYTDTEKLQWMEQEKMLGTVEGSGENRVQIKIYQEEEYAGGN